MNIYELWWETHPVTAMQLGSIACGGRPRRFVAWVTYGAHKWMKTSKLNEFRPSNDCIYILNEFYMCALCDYVGGTLMPIIMRLFPLIDHHHISDMTSITDYRWQSEHGTPPCAMSDQACFTISIVRELSLLFDTIIYFFKSTSIL